ncbi:hypothetical protein PMAYCL1PPCAC_07385 [Pristionchus mayeri]|uniref:N(6)-L-threonylcarbamoyladenine synthase n=1 Tax=Pristionchus mayeri TaxID=1317129 RepID=A0AAN5CAW6_9BILA|nr:hypothetical protein PMAYCL1PPCAC_07385 [Pristionchus mayeri]
MLRSCSNYATSIRHLHAVLGIETSCDDTAVSIVTSDRRILVSRRVNDRPTLTKLGGICPGLVAQQHRTLLRPLIEECLHSVRMRAADLSAVAVSTRPGLVIALKEGVSAAIDISRLHRIPLIPVHHMRAHALISSFCHPDLQYPFVALLVSGGHSLVALVRSADHFELIVDSVAGSAGECMDKIGRELDLDCSVDHPGAALEKAAARAPLGSHLSLQIAGVPSSNGVSFHFAALKSSLLGQLNKMRTSGESIDVDQFAAAVQHQTARHLCSRLHASLEFLSDEGSIGEGTSLVMAGGVAANSYLRGCVEKVCRLHSLRFLRLPPSLCTDNGEMIGWSGVKMVEEKSPSIIPWESVPSSLYVHAKEEIGRNRTGEVPVKTRRKIASSSIHNDHNPLVVRSKAEYRSKVGLLFDH